MVDERAVRSLLERHGQVRSQAASDWRGTFPLPAVLSEFYESVGPVNVEIPGYGNPYHLPSLANLWDHQAGYRWHHPSGERLEEWLDDWLVVADECGDPFILSRTSGRVHLAMHGQGVWEPEELFPDIYTMAACFGILGAVVEDAGAELTDGEGNLAPTYRAKAERELRDLLGSAVSAEEVLGTLGWG